MFVGDDDAAAAAAVVVDCFLLHRQALLEVRSAVICRVERSVGWVRDDSPGARIMDRNIVV